MASNLVYVSARKSNCTDIEIDKILEACKRNNANLDITGVLLYSETQFVQYLEGEFDQIFSLYNKIKEDDRHTNVFLISASQIEERAFPSWQMGAKKVDFERIEFQTDMSSGEKKEFQQILSGGASGGTKALEILKKFFN